MRAWALVAVASVMAVACNQSATPTASVSPRPTASPRAAPTNFVQVSPAPGLGASLGWDGVDNQMMLVSPVTNAVTRVVGRGVVAADRRRKGAPRYGGGSVQPGASRAGCHRRRSAITNPHLALRRNAVASRRGCGPIVHLRGGRDRARPNPARDRRPIWI